MAERKKLIDLLASVPSSEVIFGKREGKRYTTAWHIADHLIANGVTFATDNNVGSKWIPVTERLPELHGDFITAIAFEDGDILIDISVWYGKCWESLSGEPRNVTHWMPLPQPPKEGE